MDWKEENEKKKEYLRSYRKHGSRIKRIEAELEEIRSMKMNPSVQNNDGMPRGSSSQSDLSDYAAELDTLEDKLYKEGVEQVRKYKEIEYAIKQISDESEKDILYYRYIKGWDWWKVAQAMEISERQVYRLHGKALKHLQKK